MEWNSSLEVELEIAAKDFNRVMIAAYEANGYDILSKDVFCSNENLVRMKKK